MEAGFGVWVSRVSREIVDMIVEGVGGRLLFMESQEGHNPALEWRGKSAKPVRFGKNSVRF